MKYLPKNRELLIIFLIILIIIAFCCCLKARCNYSRRFIDNLYNYDEDENKDNLPS